MPSFELTQDETRALLEFAESGLPITAEVLNRLFPGRPHTAMRLRIQQARTSDKRKAFLRDRIRQWEKGIETPQPQKTDALGFSFEQGPSGASVVGTFDRLVQSLDDLKEACGIDPAAWEIVHAECRSYQGQAKVKIEEEDGSSREEVRVTQLYAVRVRLKPRAGVYMAEEIERLLKKLKENSPHIPIPTVSRVGNRRLLEIAPSDTHIGKLAWGKETGWGDYDTAAAIKVYKQVVKGLLDAAAHYKCAECLLLVGNDLLNIDSSKSETTAGTRQDGDSRFKKLFRAAIDMHIEIIESLLAPNFEKVTVICQPGNHDKETLYALGEALRCRFHNSPHVDVRNEPTTRRYFQFGKVLLGFTHGNEESIKDLPLIMAQEQAGVWGKTLYREWHIGHYHHLKKFQWMSVDEKLGVVVQVLPPLSATDSWHSGRGYVANTRAAMAFVWDKEDGGIATLMEPVKTKR